MTQMEARSTQSNQRQIILFGDFQRTGGVERCFANMVKYWTEYGNEVEIVGYRGAVPFYPDEELPARFTHLRTRSKWATRFALWRYLRRLQPDAVLATGHISNMIVARLKTWPGMKEVRCLLNVQNDFVASGKDPTGQKKKRKLAEISRTYPAADGLITTSRGVADSLATHAGLGNLPTHVIHTGVITPEMLERAKEAVDHPWLVAGRTAPVMVAAGRLARQKDYPTLLRAFARLRETMSARLIILGEGPEREKLKRLIHELGVGDHVDLYGFVGNPYAWIARSDVFVLSSQWEGFGNVVAEALGLGVPVVTTDCPSGPAEIVNNGEYGRIASVGNHEELCDALIASLKHGRLPYNTETAQRPLTAEYAARRYLEVICDGDRRTSNRQ